MALCLALTNTGSQLLENVTVTDDKVSSINCSSATLPLNGTVNCSGTYTIKAADLTAGSVTTRQRPPQQPIPT